MKKILILTYFFPPSNFAGSYRVASFAKYFHKFGFYPVIITRHAPKNAGSFSEMAQDCGKEVLFEKKDGYEVYYLPYKGNLRDRIYAQYGEHKFAWLRKILSSLELIFQYFSVKSIPYSNIYSFARKYLSEHKDIDCILSSGRPYQLFLFSHLLSKKYKIKWVADYRDEWNTWLKYNKVAMNFRLKAIYYLETFYEKKWTSSASLITTVTEHWAEHISLFLKKTCKVVLNGYDNYKIEPFLKNNKTDIISDAFTILHLGTLYEYQPVEVFLNGMIKLIDKGVKIRCIFPGVINGTQDITRLLETAHKYPESFILFPKLEQSVVFDYMNKADCFLMVGYQDVKGWMSSKVLEYLPWHKPIILCPSDNDVIEKLLKPLSKAFICNNEYDIEEVINTIITNRMLLNEKNESDDVYIKTFTRENQAKILAEHLNNIKKHESVKVLCFHRVSDEYSPAYPPMAVNTFGKLLNYLQKKYEIIGFDDICIETQKTKLILTFDDGYKDFFEHVFPLLKQKNIKAVLSIIPEMIETGMPPWTQILNKCIESALLKNRSFEIPELSISYKPDKKNVERFAVNTYLKLSEFDKEKIKLIIDKLTDTHTPDLTAIISWEQLVEIKNSGLVEIASHSMSHSNLCKINDADALHYEIAHSKSIIENKLNIKVKVFAAPNGFYNPIIEKKVFDENYTYLLGIKDENWLTYNSVIPRILVPYTGYYKNILAITLNIAKARKILSKLK